MIMLPDTADAFRRCRFCISPPVHSLAPLRSLTNTLASLADILLKKSTAARKLTVNCSLSRQSPNENESILAWLVAHAYTCSPNIKKSVIHPSYRILLITFSVRNLATATASFSIRNPFSADACRPKSAWAPLKSHKVEQVPPCIYTGRNLLGIWHPQTPASTALWTKK